MATAGLCRRPLRARWCLAGEWGVRSSWLSSLVAWASASSCDRPCSFGALEPRPSARPVRRRTALDPADRIVEPRTARRVGPNRPSRTAVCARQGEPGEPGFPGSCGGVLVAGQDCARRRVGGGCDTPASLGDRSRGFISNYLVHYLKANGHWVRGVDRPRRSSRTESDEFHLATYVSHISVSKPRRPKSFVPLKGAAGHYAMEVGTILFAPHDEKATPREQQPHLELYAGRSTEIDTRVEQATRNGPTHNRCVITPMPKAELLGPLGCLPACTL